MYIQQQLKLVQPVHTVSELTAQIRDLLEDSFDNVAVVGEISNAKLYPSGHCYFSLKDKEATLSSVCFKNVHQGLKFSLEDGLMVVARGKLSVYPPRGSYQLIVTSLEPVGIGEWQLAFEQLRQKLETEGLLDSSRKRPIPLLPARIGVVTSLAGAALRDILSALRRRNPNINVVISPSKVQGDGSAEEIAQAIGYLEKIPDIETILVCRGGGAIEDLWSFNTEVVARAVALCRVPVISGVGHETDVTICDLVADLRAPTPTAAAELVGSGRQELLDRWGNFNRRLHNTIDNRVGQARIAFERLSPKQAILRYEGKIKHLSLNVANLKARLISRMAAIYTQNYHRFEQCQHKLANLGPVNVLKRGFAILRKLDGDIVKSAASMNKGDTVEALLSNGKLIMTVIEKEENW